MKLNIPQVGYTLETSTDNNFTIKVERRNNKFIQAALGFSELKEKFYLVHVPKNTVLCVDRVYVRKGDGADFNSITVVIKSSPNKSLEKHRFFIPLDVANSIEFSEVNIRKEGKTLADVKKEAKQIWQHHREQNSYRNKINAYEVMISDLAPVVSVKKLFSRKLLLLTVRKGLKQLLSRYVNTLANGGVDVRNKKAFLLECDDIEDGLECLDRREAYLKGDVLDEIKRLTEGDRGPELLEISLSNMVSAINILGDLAYGIKDDSFESAFDISVFDYEGHPIIKRVLAVDKDDTYGVDQVFSDLLKNTGNAVLDKMNAIAVRIIERSSSFSYALNSSITEYINQGIDYQKKMLSGSSVFLKGNSSYADFFGNDNGGVFEVDGKHLNIRQLTTYITAQLKNSRTSN